MCLFCIGNPPCRSRLRGSQFQQCDCHSLRWAPAYPWENRAAPGCPKGSGARGLGWTGRLLALEGAAKSPLPQHHLRPRGLGMSQESCQPCRARPCQAQTCAGCLGRAQGDGSRLRPPRWANSLLRTSVGVAWGACCVSPLAPAQSAYLYAGGRDVPPHSVSKKLFIEGSSLLILAQSVYRNQHCPLSTYLPIFASGFRALC